MADTTVSVKQDGTGDYTTISSAVASADVSTGYYKIEIQDSNAYVESVSLTAAGTATLSNYVWLTVSEGNRHSGVAGIGHARITPSSGTALTLNDDYARAEYLELYPPSGQTGAFLNANNTLLSRCIIHPVAPTTGTGISHSAFKTPVFVDNCLVYRFRFGPSANMQGGFTSTFYYDHCTFVQNGRLTATNRTNYCITANVSGVLASNLYNTGMAGSNVQDISVTGTYTSQVSHTGTHNAWDTNTTYFGSSTGSYTSSQDISSGGLTTTTTTANAMIVTDVTGGSEDYTPVVATGGGSNLLLTNGTNRQGSEPDPRQDFSTDIAGNKRPSKPGFIDIGAFQITQAPGGFKYWDGAAWADSTAVQYWNGSAWTDVTGIQYWNGSAWTDPS